MFNLNNFMLLASTAASGTAQSPNRASSWGQLIFLLVLLVGVIVLMIVPQRKRNKQMKEMLDSIKPGTRIRTIGGIYGTVTVVKEDLVTIVTGPDDVKLVFAKGAIAVVEPAEDDKAIDEDDLEELEEKETPKD